MGIKEMMAKITGKKDKHQPQAPAQGDAANSLTTITSTKHKVGDVASALKVLTGGAHGAKRGTKTTVDKAKAKRLRKQARRNRRMNRLRAA